MKLIRHLTWQNMRSSKARTMVTVLGIILSAAMFTAVTTMGVSFRAYMMETEIAQNGDYFVRYDYGTMEELAHLRQDEAVTKLGTIKTLGYTNFKLDLPDWTIDDTLIIGAGNREFFEMVPTHLQEGRLPENGAELVITRKVYNYLEQSGQPCEIGQQLTLPIDVTYDHETLDLPTSGAPYHKTYTIVGITDYILYFEDNTLNLSTLLTFDDGSQQGLWGRFFVKTAPKDAYALAERQYGPSTGINQNLLDFYGVTKYASINSLIVSFAAVLMLIIMVGSVSLIYNAFSISISERTKQFGLLSSVGATRKQIRQSVFTEALYLSAAGIPLGICSGYAGIALTLHLTHGLIDNLLSSAAENGIIMHAVPSIPAFLAAGIVALITVLFSAWIPARRATKITPIAAIRQTQEFNVPKRGIRAGHLVQKLFGFPAALGRKYYTVNRRKYRATVISLTISMVLFVSAGSFVQQLNATAQEETNTDNFDFEVTITSQEQIQQLRAHPALRASALLSHDWAQAVIPPENLTDEYRSTWEVMAESQPHGTPISSKYVHIEYLEDEVLRAFLLEQGLDPAPYLDTENPLAFVTSAQLSLYRYDENGRATDRQRFTCPILKDSVDAISLFPGFLPNGVIDRLGGSVSPGSFCVLNGVPVYSMTVQRPSPDGTTKEVRYEVEIHPMADGHSFGYYLRDPETDVAEAEPTDTVSMEHAQLEIGAGIRELPLGIRQNTDYDAITVILPLSAAKPQPETVTMAVSTSDYETFLHFLKENDYVFSDYLASQMQYRDYVTMIRIFSYGFIILISLICVCNVFNTISTNIALRKKDFGMLRSVGMKNKEINRMMAFECLQYGLKTILWGIPLSILACFLIARVVDMSDFTLPTQAMAAAAGFIFVSVFITMFYAVSKLKNQNPMEAIRAES